MIVVYKYGYPPGTATPDISVPGWQRPLLPLVGKVALSLIRRRKARQAWEEGMGRRSGQEVVATLARPELMAYHDRIAQRYWA